MDNEIAISTKFSSFLFIFIKTRFSTVLKNELFYHFINEMCFNFFEIIENMF
jgi:hypothetical protein